VSCTCRIQKLTLSHSTLLYIPCPCLLCLLTDINLPESQRTSSFPATIPQTATTTDASSRVLPSSAASTSTSASASALSTSTSTSLPQSRAFDPKSVTQIIKPSLTLRVPLNVSNVLIADVDGDGRNEMLLGSRNRTLHTYELSSKGDLFVCREKLNLPWQVCSLSSVFLLDKTVVLVGMEHGAVYVDANNKVVPVVDTGEQGPLSESELSVLEDAPRPNDASHLRMQVRGDIAVPISAHQRSAQKRARLACESKRLRKDALRKRFNSCVVPSKHDHDHKTEELPQSKPKQELKNSTPTHSAAQSDSTTGNRAHSRNSRSSKDRRVKSEEELESIAQGLINGVAIENRMWYLSRHRSCFVGSHAVDWLRHKHIAVSEQDAVDICSMLMQAGAFSQVSGESKFQNGYKLYRFWVHEPDTCALPSQGPLRLVRAYRQMLRSRGIDPVIQQSIASSKKDTDHSDSKEEHQKEADDEADEELDAELDDNFHSKQDIQAQQPLVAEHPPHALSLIATCSGMLRLSIFSTTNGVSPLCSVQLQGSLLKLETTDVSGLNDNAIVLGCADGRTVIVPVPLPTSRTQNAIAIGQDSSVSDNALAKPVPTSATSPLNSATVQMFEYPTDEHVVLSDDILFFDLNTRVQAFAAAPISFGPDRNPQCFVYVTFDDEIRVFYDIDLRIRRHERDFLSFMNFKRQVQGAGHVAQSPTTTVDGHSPLFFDTHRAGIDKADPHAEPASIEQLFGLSQRKHKTSKPRGTSQGPVITLSQDVFAASDYVQDLLVAATQSLHASHDESANSHGRPNADAALVEKIVHMDETALDLYLTSLRARVAQHKRTQPQ
jgi:Domain found in Dishevelled, Egl-10, and Pleckstrin (DEP)/Integrin-alpha FG-GAP repeat-containing protein 2